MSRHPDSSLRSSRASRGFTLVEVLVAVTLLTTALVPAYVLSGNATKLSLRIRNELTAAALAQEGVEIVRAIRDANWFKGVDFATGLGGCGGGCTFQYNSDGPESDDPADTLSRDPDTGLFLYGDGDETPFSREVTITREPPAGPELIVTSSVRWEERGQPRSVTVEYHVFNWLQ